MSERERRLEAELAAYKGLLATARAEVERMKEGEQWAASKFREIMAVAVSGFADAAVIAQQKLTADHSLAAVVKLKEHAATLNAEVLALRREVCEIAVPIEVLVGSHHTRPFTEISSDLMQSFFSAMLTCRAIARHAALASAPASTPDRSDTEKAW